MAGSMFRLFTPFIYSVTGWLVLVGTVLIVLFSLLGVPWQRDEDLAAAICSGNAWSTLRQIFNGASVNGTGDAGSRIVPLVEAMDDVSCPKFMPSLWVRALIFLGADVNGKDSRGYTPLIMAVYNNNRESVELLLAKGAIADQRLANGDTAMDIAKRQEYLDIARLLGQMQQATRPRAMAGA